MLVVQQCLTPCDSMNYSLPGSSVHGILQARRPVGSHFFLQENFPTHESPSWQVDSLPSEPAGKFIYKYAYIQMEKSNNPTQYSCLDKPSDRGDWQAIIHRVKKSWTQLKRLSMHAFIQKSLLSKCYLWTAYIRG